MGDVSGEVTHYHVVLLDALLVRYQFHVATTLLKLLWSLQWRHNGRDIVSNYWRLHCLLNRLFRRRSKKSSRLRVTGLCEGNSPVTCELPSQGCSNVENVFIWWRYHELSMKFRFIINSGPNIISVPSGFLTNFSRHSSDYKERHLHDDVIKWKHFPRYWPWGREITDYRWIPLTKASDAELWCFVSYVPEPLETPSCPLWLHCNVRNFSTPHYDDVIMNSIASQITSLTIVYSNVYSGADQSKHQSSASLAFVWRIHRGTVNSPHKWPITRKIFPFDDVIMGRVILKTKPWTNDYFHVCQ